MADQHRVTEADIRAVLAGTYTQEAFDAWWLTRTKNLRWFSPAQALARGDEAKVLAEAERMAGAM